MAFQPCPDVAKCALEGTLAGELYINTLYALHPPDTPWTAEELQALANGVFDAWVTNPALMTDIFTFKQVTATNLSVASGPQRVSTGSPVNGSNTTGTQPNNVAWTIKFTTDAIGRSFRGHNQIGAVPRGDMADLNHVIEAYASAWIDIYTLIQTAMTTAGGAMCVLSRRADKAERDVGIGTVITGIGYTDLTVDSQRTRLPNRGR